MTRVTIVGAVLISIMIWIAIIAIQALTEAVAIGKTG